MSARNQSRIWLALGLLPWVLACGEDTNSGAGGTVTPAVEANASTPLVEYGDPEPFPLVPANLQETLITLSADADLAALLAEYELDLLDQYPSGDGLLVRVGNPQNVNLDDLPSEDGVEAVDPNLDATLGEVQTLILGFLEGGFDPEAVSTQSWIGDLELPAVHATATGEGVLIAVLDTGAYFAHPLLQGKMVEIPPERGLGSHEYKDNIDNDGDSEIDECFGHGSHVAGCIAITAPGATILPIRVMTDDGVGSLWDILRGIEIARDMGVDIISMSLTMQEANDSMEDALAACREEGIVIVSAAGNGGNRHPGYPATSTHVVGVASVGDGSALSEFSGAGPLIALAAPGESIVSAYPRDDLCSATGTSMATPIAVGCVALVMDALGLSAETAIDRLCSTSTAISPVVGVAHGRVSPVLAIAP